jgi:hypothetical protein
VFLSGKKKEFNHKVSPRKDKVTQREN